MKKLYYSALAYLIAALVSGVLWRELAKFNDVTEATSLGKVHGHLMTLGFIMFLLFIIMERIFHISAHKQFNLFFIVYHIGVITATLMMLIRGYVSIMVIKGSLDLSDGLDAAISGMAGLSHIVLSLGLILFMVILKKSLFPVKK
ncbi:DUF2871 domain-containing protein [Bacillus testis]|uniref:DUF2871 domain-containing protein n=1 Tax=Bacillus testis TaxID=1622072 RepID=UPI00067F0454|nr:DUF2871 domain-containing protein [Bacillus testis]